jgi:hypothetical protein
LINDPELLVKILKLWDELSNDLEMFNYLEHQKGCSAAPVYWADPTEQPECTCGFEQVANKYNEIERTIGWAERKRMKRVLRKSYNLVINSYKGCNYP